MIFRNPIVPCDAISIPRIDLTHWKEDVSTLNLFSENSIPSSVVNAASGGALGSTLDNSPNPFAAFDVNTIFEEKSDETRRRKNIYDLNVQFYGK